MRAEAQGATEISLYVHVPFCRVRCSFCGSYSATAQEERAGDFLQALEREWELVRAEEGLTDERTHRVVSVYVGGGTPSLIGGERLVGMLSLLREGPSWAQDCEVTVQVNPEDAQSGLVQSLLAAGCQRISLGVQSFADEDLKQLARPHDARAARRAVAVAREEGCRNLNLDLMYGVPGQSAASWEETLREAIAAQPQHIGCNRLARGEETVLDRLLRADFGATTLEEATLQHYQTAQVLLADAGYELYEIRNAALPGFRCRHHLRVWSRAPWYGLGAGAHSFDGHRRWRNAPDVQIYFDRLLGEGRRPPRDGYRLSAEDRGRELLYLGLRRSAGVRWEDLDGDLDQMALRRVRRKSRFLAAQGYLVSDEEGVRLQPQAYYVVDSVVLELIRAFTGGSE